MKNRKQTYKKVLLLLLVVVFVSCGNKPKQKGLIYYNDFETIKGWNKDINLAKTPIHSGIYSNKLDSTHMYGSTLKLRFKEVEPDPIRKIKCSLWCYLKTNKTQGKIVLAIPQRSRHGLDLRRMPVRFRKKRVDHTLYVGCGLCPALWRRSSIFGAGLGKTYR